MFLVLCLLERFVVYFIGLCLKKTVHAGLNVRFNEEKQITSDNEIQKWAKQIVK